MKRFDSAQNGRIDRRRFIAAAGGVGIVTLAGCTGGNDSDTQNSDEESESSDQSTEEQTQDQDQTSQRSQDYPQKEPESSLEERLMRWPDNSEDKYLFKIDDLSYVNQEGLASNEGSDVRTYEEALYEALNADIEGGTDSIWFAPTSLDVGGIDMIVNAEDRENFGEGGSYRGFSDEFQNPGAGADPELAESEYAEFLSEYVDDDGIVNHAGEIPEYAREALSNGWQA